jgi:hypothetical protein
MILALTIIAGVVAFCLACLTGWFLGNDKDGVSPADKLVSAVIVIAEAQNRQADIKEQEANWMRDSG